MNFFYKEIINLLLQVSILILKIIINIKTKKVNEFNILIYKKAKSY